jgi:hypothetical protein
MPLTFCLKYATQLNSMATLTEAVQPHVSEFGVLQHAGHYHLQDSHHGLIGSSECVLWLYMRISTAP